MSYNRAKSKGKRGTNIFENVGLNVEEINYPNVLMNSLLKPIQFKCTSKLPYTIK